MVAKFQTILIVDDEKDVVDSLTRTMSANGRKVFGVTSPSEAYMRTANTEYDLIVTDLKMPKTDGLTLIKGIRSHKINKNTPIILMTGFTEGLAEQIKQFSNVQILAKPFSPEDLLALANLLIKLPEETDSKKNSQIEIQILNEVTLAANATLKQLTGHNKFQSEPPVAIEAHSEICLDFTMVLKVKSPDFKGTVAIGFPLLTIMKLINSVTKDSYTVINEKTIRQVESILNQILETAIPSLQDMGIKIDQKAEFILADDPRLESLYHSPTLVIAAKAFFGDLYILGSAA